MKNFCGRLEVMLSSDSNSAAGISFFCRIVDMTEVLSLRNTDNQHSIIFRLMIRFYAKNTSYSFYLFFIFFNVLI